VISRKSVTQDAREGDALLPDGEGYETESAKESSMKMGNVSASTDSGTLRGLNVDLADVWRL